MKTLLLMRHAKSSWDNDRLADFERPLNERGRHDAPRMGKLLRSHDLVPDLIISSSAKRAASTAEIVAETVSYDGDIRLADDLYLAEPGQYVLLARQAPAEVDTLMFVGHNPGIEELVEWLTGEAERMPTAAVACVRLSIADWSQLQAAGKHEKVEVWRPREL